MNYVLNNVDYVYFISSDFVVFNLIDIVNEMNLYVDNRIFI